MLFGSRTAETPRRYLHQSLISFRVPCSAFSASRRTAPGKKSVPGLFAGEPSERAL
jgi:hypothetical protein